MGWWDHLQTAQGTVLGGAFVLAAAFVAWTLSHYNVVVADGDAR